MHQQAIRVESVEDAVGGDGLPGRRVSVPGLHEAARFLFRGVPGLRAGRVPSSVVDLPLHPGRPVSLGRWRGGDAVLEAVCVPPPSGAEDAQVPAKVVLRQGGRTQELLHFQAAFHKGEYVGPGQEGVLKVLWIGDLNGDGRVDFILDLSDHYNVRLPTLFLGQPGGKGALVAPVAQQRSVGC